MSLPDPSIYLQLFASIPVPAIVGRMRDHRIIAINERGAHMIGVDASEVVNRLVTDYHRRSRSCRSHRRSTP
jgi:hypothetical protein